VRRAYVEALMVSTSPGAEHHDTKRPGQSWAIPKALSEQAHPEEQSRRNSTRRCAIS
jgi:hypothetical protein